MSARREARTRADGLEGIGTRLRSLLRVLLVRHCGIVVVRGAIEGLGGFVLLADCLVESVLGLVGRLGYGVQDE